MPRVRQKDLLIWGPMQIIGLTGGIASGKSTVSQMLKALGARVLDADAIYHQLIQPEGREPSPLARQIGERFEGVLKADGTIDRKALGSQVFGNQELLVALGQITHPAVAKEFGRQMDALRAQGLPRLVYDVPLLFERGLNSGMDEVIVVWVPPEIQRQRLMQRDGITAEEADRRLASQLPLNDKRDRATRVIDNSGSLDDTRRQVEATWAELCA